MTPQRALRQRLMSPPNAVPDTGINMRNGRPILKVVEPPPPPRCEWSKPTLTLVWEAKPLPVSRDIRQVMELPYVLNRDKEIGISVVNETCTVWGIEQYRLLSKARFRDIVRPRQSAMVIIRRLTTFSYPNIGKFFGGIHHSTIIHATWQMAPHIAALNEELTDSSPPAEWVRALKARLEA